MTPTAYVIQYASLRDARSVLSFPCDGQGHVDLDELSPKAIECYLFARALVGRDFAMPAVVEQTSDPSPRYI